jgi:hypothetical protein
MTSDEFGILVKAMKAVYTAPTFIPDQYAFNVWYEMLKDLDYKTCAMAVQKYIVSCKYPPLVADIREQYRLVTMANEPTEMEAWGLVSRALRNGYYGAEEEFKKLPEIVQKAVGNASQLRNWSQTNIESVENVIQSNFIRTYRAVVNRAHEDAKLPPKILQTIRSLDIEGYDKIALEDSKKAE